MASRSDSQGNWHIRHPGATEDIGVHVFRLWEFKENSNVVNVWAKGDKCVSPYSGDSELYRGVIRQLRRSPQGDVFALVKFDGYDDIDSEEVSISQLQKVKPKEKTIKPNRSHESDGMFQPLQGKEFVDHRRAKYEAAEEEEEACSEKREKLSQVLFEKQIKTEVCPSPSQSASRKGIVAIGGEAISGRKGRPRARPTIGDGDGVTDETTRSPSGRKKAKLDIRGGAAIDTQSDLRTSKPLSDISSIVDPDVVHKVLRNERVTKPSTPLSEEEEEEIREEKVESDRRVEPDKGEETGCDSGFDEEDMEKPRFRFTSCGVKVPYILSDPEETPVIQVPATINQYLRDYQREGIRFLYNHYKHDRGAILGDDMGLGKTVQVIGFLSALLGKKGNRIDVMRQKPKFIRKLSDSASISADTVTLDPFLIIGPGCVLYNWLEELETWGYFTVRKFHGPDKQECLKEVRKGKVEVVVTTFETFREHQKVLNEITWSAVIADEVHKIKGLKAQTTKALRGINTTKRFGLTGTALQNNLLEFWSLLDWAQPGCLGSQADFEDEYVKDIEVGQRHDANKRELALARKKREKFARIRQDMMIRRTKKIISDQLPKKDDNVVFCKPSKLQLTMYQTILDHRDMGLILHMGDPCPCDSGLQQSKCCFKKTEDGQSVRALMFTFMHLLLKVSNHVALIIPKHKSTEKQARHAEQICKAAFAEHPDFMTQTREASFRTLSDPKYCGKMKILQGLLKVFDREHSKVLLFSYSTQVLDIIEQYLMSTGHEYRRIDGSVSPKKRMIIVREFNTDPNLFICLVSTKAGGLGLNLTGANRVVIFDPNWNPTHDLQAQDRAYRIGQRRNVQVYRLVSAGTIEENMYLRQIYKQQLLNVTVEDENARRYFYAVQGNPRQKGELFGIKNMFHLRTGESCLTMDILKRNQRVETVLAGCEMARYVPPVIRLEDEEDDDDDDNPTPGLDNSQESNDEDLFEQFFATQAAADVTVDEDSDGDRNDDDDADKPKSKKKQVKKTSKADQGAEADDGSSESDHDREIIVEAHKKKAGRVRFQEEAEGTGKVRPSQSKKGKGPVKGSARAERKVQHQTYDQTLAGDFDDVTDVFDQCGVVHIHKNMKVVGGSRAEDHMSRCAITDVYELHQNSQDLAVQCQPMSESSEEEETEKEKEKKKKAVSQLNTPRSITVGNSKVLIGQTPKFYRQKQFEDLRKFHGASSMLEFAELVLKSSLEERVTMLNQFYGSSDDDLKDVLKLETTSVRSEKKKMAAKIMKAKPESVTNKKRRKYLKVRHGAGVSFIDADEAPNNQSLGPASLDRDSLGEPGNMSLSPASLELSVQGTGDEIDGSSIDVSKMRENISKKLDRKTPGTAYSTKTNAKKGNTAQTKAKNKSRDVLDVELMDFSDSDTESCRKRKKGRSGTKLAYTDDNASVEDLLGEMSRYSEETVSEKSITEFRRASPKKPDKREKKDKVKPKKTDPTTNILDDLFGDSDTVVAKRKPPPAQPRSEQVADKTEKVEKRSNKSSAFKEVDEIFSTSADDESDLSEVHLDTSTLKDDEIDCFSDPTKWKKRKTRTPDRRKVADRLIADSEEEYNDLFRRGKLRKKEVQAAKPSASRKESVEEIDGSFSLFS